MTLYTIPGGALSCTTDTDWPPDAMHVLSVNAVGGGVEATAVAVM